MNILHWLRRWRMFVLVAAALGFGALGVAGTHGFISEQINAEKQRLAREHKPTQVVVAARDLAAGTVLHNDMLASREVPARYAPASAVHAGDHEALYGQVLLVSMKAGEPVLATAIDYPADGFSTRVRHGIRALTIEVDEVNSVSGMLRPGDRIDLLFSTRSPLPGQNGTDISRPLMQDLPVLATGAQTHDTTRLERPMNSFTTITVEVSPEQAQKLVLAQRSGRLTARSDAAISLQGRCAACTGGADLASDAVDVVGLGRRLGGACACRAGAD